MKRVLDSCVAFKWVIPEADSDKALRLRDDFRHALIDLIAPDVFPIEIMHALTKAERQGRLATPQGGLHWADVMRTAPQFHSSLLLLPRA